jgi:hypothetical protein
MKGSRFIFVVALVVGAALLPLDAQQGPPRGPRPARTRKVVLAWADTRERHRAARFHLARVVGDRAARL